MPLCEHTHTFHILWKSLIMVDVVTEKHKRGKNKWKCIHFLQQFFQYIDGETLAHDNTGIITVIVFTKQWFNLV